MSAGAPVAITRFEFAGGELRGSDLSLYENCLVHRGAGALETLPLAGLSSVRVEFLRETRRIGWGVAWLVLALLLLAATGPLARLSAAASHELAAQGASGGVGGALLGFFAFLQGLSGAFPLLAAVLALVAAALCAFGWLGRTTLTVSYSGGERSFAVRGRNAMLLAFSERLAEQLMARQ